MEGTRHTTGPTKGLRRPKKTGTRLANGRWRVRLTIAGKQRDFYGATLEAAQLKAAKEHAGETVQQDNRTTVGGWLTEWVETQRHTLKPGTWRKYESVIRLHVVPHIGRRKLADLTGGHLLALYADLARNGLSGSSRHHVHTVVGTGLQAALDRGVIRANPARTIKAPRLNAHEKTVLSQAEAARLLDKARADRFYALWVLALTTGMRIGELLALRWRDVDLDARRLTINQTAGRGWGVALELTAPKTPAARRVIELPEIAATALRATPRTDNLVFPSTSGTIMSPANLLHRHFAPLREAAKLPDSLRIHDLRHTAITHMLEGGVQPHAVAKAVGHASVNVTLSVYGHVTPKMSGAAAAAMDARYEGL